MEANVYSVRSANYEDCEAIMSLVMELAAHVKCEHEVKIKADRANSLLLAMINTREKLVEHEQQIDCLFLGSTISDHTASLQRDGFGDNSLFHCLVAEVNKDVIGYLLYYYTYSPWVGKTVYMEDFYVKPEHRNNGIGTNLLKTAVKVFLDTHCNCMEWAVPCWNKVAVDYYKQKGAINLTETEQLHIYRLTEEAMQNLLSK